MSNGGSWRSSTTSSCDEVLDARLATACSARPTLSSTVSVAPRASSLPAEEREVGRRVVEERVPAPLRLEQQRERGVAADVDAVDRVHLAGDAQGQEPRLLGRVRAA